MEFVCKQDYRDNAVRLTQWLQPLIFYSVLANNGTLWVVVGINFLPLLKVRRLCVFYSNVCNIFITSSAETKETFPSFSRFS